MTHFKATRKSVCAANETSRSKRMITRYDTKIDRYFKNIENSAVVRLILSEQSVPVKTVYIQLCLFCEHVLLYYGESDTVQF